MEDSPSLPQISHDPSLPLTCICANEITIRNHPYIISMCINHSEQPQIEIKVEAKESADQWKSSFNAATIEKITAKTGNFKSFDVFINMLENAINQKSSSVNIDLFTCDDLESIRHKQQQQHQRNISSTKLSTKRYLILIYNAEYDHVYYPLSLRYCGKPDPAILIEQIRQLAAENQLLKSQFEPTSEYSQIQNECLRLQKENEDYREQLFLFNSKEKDQQIEFLRQMIRTSEDALSKERNNLKKTKIKKDDRYKSLLNQIDSLKVSERQLKLQVKSLTNEIHLVSKKCSPSKSHQRSSSVFRSASTDQPRRYRSASVIKPISSSTDSHARFNPTAYVHERNLKLRQIELQKKKETRQRLNSGGCHSDSDISDINLKFNDHDQQRPKNQKHNSRFQFSSRQKRTNNLRRHKSNDSIDSDIERVSSPPILRKALSNNSTIICSAEHSHNDQQNVNSNSINNTVDIDQRLKSLQKFIKQNLRH